jgi:hypothetical protein
MAAKKKAAAKKAAAKKAAAPGKAAGPKVACPSAASAATEAAAAPDLATIDIPLHLQDKEGFCGAACMMMLLEDAFPECLQKISQSALMRRVKQYRDAWQVRENAERDKARKEGREPKISPAEALYAWHASPRELTAVMNECHANPEAGHTCKLGTEVIEKIDDSLKKKPWKAVGCQAWKATRIKGGAAEPIPPGPKAPYARDSILASIGEAKGKGPGCIALIWHRSLGTSHPHWVVIERYDNAKNSFLILDPSPAGRSHQSLRYDSFPHYAVKRGCLPYHCGCLVWRDANNEPQAASKHWIHEDRLEELLDEAAARCGGLRYIVVRNMNVGGDSIAAYENARGWEESMDKPTLAESLRKQELSDKLAIIYKELSPLLGGRAKAAGK